VRRLPSAKSSRNADLKLPLDVDGFLLDIEAAQGSDDDLNRIANKYAEISTDMIQRVLAFTPWTEVEWT